MGLYRAIGRPLMFALPPETAHKVAATALRAPLPWAYIGGAVGGETTATDLAGIRIRNPIGLAAGFDKNATMLEGLGKLGFGYLVAGTVTRDPRRGNPRPRIVRRPAKGSMVNSMGLPNDGAAAIAARLRGLDGTAPVLASIADQARDDVSWNHRLLEPLCAGIELNVSCPNVSWGRDRDNEAHLKELVGVLAQSKTKPLFVKLPPFRSALGREAVVAVAEMALEAGADGFTCSNTLPAEDPGLAMRRGGLSGAEISDLTPEIVEELRKEIGPDVPINACGGIATVTDARRCLDAGATTLQVYTGLIYRGPRILRDLTSAALVAASRAGGQD